MDPERRLVGLVLRPNEVVHVKSEFFEDLDGRDWALHITQAALTKDAEPGKNAICVVDDAGVKFVLAILEQGRCENSQVVLVVSSSVSFVNDGESEVHLTGYKSTNDPPDFNTTPPESPAPDLIAEELLSDHDSERESKDGNFEDEVLHAADLELAELLKLRALKGTEFDDSDISTSCPSTGSEVQEGEELDEEQEALLDECRGLREEAAEAEDGSEGKIHTGETDSDDESDEVMEDAEDEGGEMEASKEATAAQLEFPSVLVSFERPSFLERRRSDTPAPWAGSPTAEYLRHVSGPHNEQHKQSPNDTSAAGKENKSVADPPPGKKARRGSHWLKGIRALLTGERSSSEDAERFSGC